VTQIGRDPGLCASVVLTDDIYVVRDAIVDPRTTNHPLVLGELGLRFYAAAPIRSADGFRLGTVNVIDREPREATEQQTRALADLAAIVTDLLELRLSALQLLRTERAARQQAEQAAAQLRRLAREARDTGEVPAQCSVDVVGARRCDRPAEVRIADPSGESAWTCAQHAEEALLSTLGVFLADPHAAGVAQFLSRIDKEA
jgi:GAF domain-containing protein